MQFENGWRAATPKEILDLLAESGAPHVTFGCMGCGMVNWTAKNLALSPDGRYTAERNIFVMEWEKGECKCAAGLLRCVVKE